MKAALASIPKEFQMAADKATKAWEPMETLGTGLLDIGKTLSAAVTLPLVGIGAAAIKVGEDLNVAELAFTTMLGSAEKSKQFLDELKTFAAATPFEFTDLVQAAKRMQAMGFEAEKVVPTLRTVGDTVAAMGGGKDVIDGITNALAQMQNRQKVSAEEMNQLVQRGVKAWEYLAQGIGVSIPEAMKLAEKGAISASVAIPAILQGMQQKFGGQMEKMSATLTGTWSNFKDTLTLTLAEIGQTLTPILTQIVQAAMPLLDWAKQAAQWFSQLPDPIQKGALAFAAMAAAVGPILLVAGQLATSIAALMPVLTGLGTTLGIGTAAVLGWAAAIPIAVAALVALGTWVYANWEPIKAVVEQAWDGLTDMWSAQWSAISGVVLGAWNGIASAIEPVFGPIRDFFGMVWSDIEGVFSAAWNGIKSALTSVWDSIKASASAVWGSIVSVFQTFLEWAGKIPGVNKLFNLDDAWKSAKKLSDETSKASQSTEDLKKEADSAAGGSNKPLPKLSIALGEVGAEAKSVTEEFTPLINKSGVLFSMAKQLEDQHRRLGDEVAAAKLKFGDLKTAIPELIQPADQLTLAIGRMISETQAVAPAWTATIDAVDAELQAALKPVQDLEQAYRDLGINSTAEVQSHATKAREAYDAIKNSGTATTRDLDAAWVAYESARIAAAKAAGEAIPAETEKALAAVKEKINGTAGNSAKTAWSDWSNQVSTIITDLGKKMADVLWDGDLSWAEKGKSVLKSLGESVTRAFVEPATKAIGDLISGAISDLIGGKGFGGILDRVRELGSAVSGVFGGGGSAIGGTAGSVGGAASGAGGSVGGIGGSVGSAGGAAAGAGTAAIVGAVGGVVSAISGVIGNFQMAKMETTLNAIEESTRYAKFYLGDHGGWSIMDNTGKTREFLGYVNTSLDSIGVHIGDIKGAFSMALTRLDQIGNDVKWGSASEKAAESILNDIRHEIRAANANPPAVHITVNVTGGGSPQSIGRDIANALALELRMQGGFA
jgi:tape measure domain-containing protein